MKGSGVVGIGRDDIEPVDEGRISVPKFALGRTGEPFWQK